MALSGEDMMMSRVKSGCCLFVAFCLYGMTVAAGSSVRIRTIALSGETVPGTNTAIHTFSYPAYNGGPPAFPIAWPPQISESGRICFWATLNPPDADGYFDSGIWTGKPGRFDLVARSGSVLPGAPAGAVVRRNRVRVDWETYIYLYPPVFSARGDVALWAELDASPYTGVWSRSAQGLLLNVALAGDLAPGAGPGVTFTSDYWMFPDIENRSGDVAFLSGLSDFNRYGIWRNVPGGLQLMALSGRPVVNLAPDTRYEPGDFFVSSRSVAFNGGIYGPSVPQNWAQAVLIADGNEVRSLAVQGDPAPDTPPGTTFDSDASGSFRRVIGNSRDQWLIWSHLKGPDTVGQSDVGLWRVAGDGLKLVTRTGQHAPGTEAGVLFNWIYPFRMDNRGRVLFSSTLIGPGVTNEDDRGIWLASENGSSLVVREGQPAPGIGEGATFGDPLGGDYLAAALNNSNRIAILANVTAPGQVETDRAGLWLKDDVGNLNLITHAGGSFEVRPGDTRAVDWVSFIYWGSSVPNALNDRGRLAFFARFTDGSEGIFVADVGLRGDLNCDGSVNAFDIQPMVMALSDAERYRASWPACDRSMADLDGNGSVNSFDIQPFIETLGAP